MDPEDASAEAARPLLKDDTERTAPLQSDPSLLGGGGDGIEIDEEKPLPWPLISLSRLSSRSSTERGRCSCRKIPTLAFILVPTVLFTVALFLCVGLMPTSTQMPDTPSPNTDNPPLGMIFGQKKPHDDPVAPTLLSIRDNQGLMNVRNNYLYEQLKTATFHGEIKVDSMFVSSGEPSAKLILQSDKRKIGFGDSLKLTWENNHLGMVDDDDIIALYCHPSAEVVDAKQFRDAATISQVKATHAHHHAWREAHNIWSIPSFPIVREESCNFRYYAHDLQGGEHHYTLISDTGPIFLTSNQNPTLVHIGLTGDPSEMNIQFATTDSGEPLVKIVKKGDEMSDWTKVKGVSTTYDAEDMCQEPANSTEPGWFVSPGWLHTVRVTGLEPNTEYVYRVGLGFGQGIKWSDDHYDFRSSLPAGSGPPTIGEPAVTFLALADQGCTDSIFKNHPSKDSAGENVTRLITSIVDSQTINAIHHFGDLSYADGHAHVWDAWMKMIEPFASRVPVMVGVGNHEYDHSQGGGDRDPSGVESDDGFHPTWGEGSFKSEGGECGVPVSKRFAVPHNGNGVFWYSYDQSLVHTVMLSSEHNMTRGSAQYTWLESDLASVNRTLTPWLVIEMHRPMYVTEVVYDNETKSWQGPIVAEGMQDEIEDLLYTYQVDVVLSGHYHSYLRTCDGLYLHKCDNGGPLYFTVGTGGAPLNGNGTTILQGEHYTEHFSKEHWGVGRATVFNASSMHWEFIEVEGNVLDEVWITRDRGVN